MAGLFLVVMLMAVVAALKAGQAGRAPPDKISIMHRLTVKQIPLGI